jgi:hypothetical protein
VQPILIRLCAESRREDGTRFDPGARELIAVRALEVEKRSIAAAGRKPCLDRLRCGTPRAERFHDVRTDLTAARAEARTDRRNQIGRAGSELTL